MHENEVRNFLIELCGRQVPAIDTAEGVRAVTKGKPVDSQSVERYLEIKFGESLGAVRSAMRDLTKSCEPEELMKSALGLYEEFRPETLRV